MHDHDEDVENRGRHAAAPVARAHRTRHAHRRRRAGGLVATALVASGTTLLVATAPTGALATDAPAAPVVVAEPAAPAYATIPLYLEGLTTMPGGRRVPLAVGTDATFLAGTHVVDPAASTLARVVAGSALDERGATVSAAASVAIRQRAWLAAGTVPGAGGPYEDMARAALLDLHALQLPDGAAVAAWSEKWRYVWPRDASFVAVALARTGHVDDALEILGFLDRVQATDGSFQARYLPDGSGPPDDRGVQTDGTGWALWASGLVLAEIADPDERAEAAEQLLPLVQRSARHAIALVALDGLPPASPDYWEVPEDTLTLGTVAPLVAGLQQAVGRPGPRRRRRAGAVGVRRLDPLQGRHDPRVRRHRVRAVRERGARGRRQRLPAAAVPDQRRPRGRGGVAGVGDDHGAARERARAGRRVARRRRLVDPADVALRVGGGGER